MLNTFTPLTSKLEVVIQQLIICYNISMKITVLVENNTRIDNYLLAEPALSLLIEHKEKKILFDTAYSDIFMQNAKSLGIDLNKITDIVLSHGHDDHTGGLRFFRANNSNIKLTAHPNIFDKKIDIDGTSYGCPVLKEELNTQFQLNLTKSPYYITDDLLFLGEIENNISNDIDDSALVYIMQKSLFIITGCSHSGIINIINYAKKVTKINKIYGILGGFHLLDKTAFENEAISRFFKQESIKYLAPCHCCDLKSKIILSQNNDIKEICAGDSIILE